MNRQTRRFCPAPNSVWYELKAQLLLSLMFSFLFVDIVKKRRQATVLFVGSGNKAHMSKPALIHTMITADGIPLLLVHGLGDEGDTWRLVLPLLPTSLRGM